MYYYALTTTVPLLKACTFKPSVNNPGKTILVQEGGLALVVEPTGLIRSLRPGEDADSPWCWADMCNNGSLIAYRSDGGAIVAFGAVTK